MKASHKILTGIIVVFLILPACIYILNHSGSKKEEKRIASVFNNERVLSQINTLVLSGKKASRGMSFASDSKYDGNSVELNVMPGSISLQNDTLKIELIDESDVYQGRLLLIGLKTVIRNGKRYLIDNGVKTWPVDTASVSVKILSEDILPLRIAVGDTQEIIAPTSGVIDGISYDYYTDEGVISEPFDNNINIDSVAESMSKLISSPISPEKLRMSVTLLDKNGYKITISGLAPESKLRTGKRIIKGEVIGWPADSVISIYTSYNGIKVSSKDYLNNSLRLEKTDKPSSVNPASHNFTASQMKEDINILIDSYKECFPGWNEHVKSQTIDSTVSEIKKSLPDTLSPLEIEFTMRRLNALLHDSHIFYDNNTGFTDRNYYDLEFGLEKDKVIVTLATNDKAKHLKVEVIEVDGIPIDSIVRFAKKLIGGYDMNVQDYPNNLLYGGLSNLYRTFQPSKQGENTLTLTLASGEQILAERLESIPNIKDFQPDISQYININRYPQKKYKIEVLHDSIAYIGLSTFDLYQTDLDSLISIICDSRYSTMIVDLRNNPGGPAQVTEKLLNTICGDAFPWSTQHNIINKRGDFKAFIYSTNYTVGSPVVGEDFIPDTVNGYFVYHHSALTIPHGTSQCNINPIFIILNEMSGSAASYFASALHRSGQAVIIGREPRTAYHHMTAVKDCQLRLPNSGVIWHIPMIREVFDTDTISDIPYGRGVLPDVYIPLTFDEVAFTNGDILKDKAIEMALKNGDSKVAPRYHYIMCASLVLILLLIVILILWKVRSQQK